MGTMYWKYDMGSYKRLLGQYYENRVAMDNIAYSIVAVL